MAKAYKGHEKYADYALRHIEANNIRCRHYKWVCMAGDVDTIMIDGKYRYFNVMTHQEIQRA